MHNLTLEVNDQQIHKQILAHIHKVSKSINVIFGSLVILSLVGKIVNFTIKPEFYDEGILVVQDACASFYFVVWALLYFTRFQDYSRYCSPLVPFTCLIYILCVEFRWKDNMKVYDPEV